MDSSSLGPDCGFINISEGRMRVFKLQRRAEYPNELRCHVKDVCQKICIAIAIPVGSFVTARFSVFRILLCIANFQAILFAGSCGCPRRVSDQRKHVDVSIRSRSDVWRAGSAANLGMVQQNNKKSPTTSNITTLIACPRPWILDEQVLVLDYDPHNLPLRAHKATQGAPRLPVSK